jgi:hypothetical protein
MVELSLERRMREADAGSQSADTVNKFGLVRALILEAVIANEESK